MPLGGEAHNPESATGAGYVPYVGATATVDLGAQNMITTGEVQGINVTSGVDPGHTHSDYIPYTGATQAVDLGAFGVTADSLVLTNPLAVSYGGTGLSVGTQYALIYFSATDAIGMIGIGTPTYLLAVNATGDGYEWVAAPVPAVAFTDLTDVPNSYAGQGGKLVAVKADVSGLEFVSGSGGVTDHDLLNNLNWAAAGHTFDTNLVLGAFYAELEEILTPATPSDNLVRVYAKDNSGVSALYYITDDGTEVGPLGTGGGGGAVDSVFGRTGAVVAVTNDYTWAQIDKTISDLSDITTKSHTVLDDIGTNTHSTIDSHIADSTIHFVDAFVHLTGNESIDGLKTFTTLPQCSVVPTNDNDLVNKLYVDTFAQGLSVRESCSVATTANITLSGVQTIDGVLVSVGNRVLVKNQSIQANNGIYVVAAGAWSRALDYDASSEVQEGTFTAILLGTTNTGKLFVQVTIDPTLGVSSLVFSQLSTPPVYTSDNGITRTTYNFQLGGTIIKDTVFTIVGANNIIFDLATSGATGDFLIRKVGTGNVFGVYENGNTGIGTTGAANYQLYIKPQADNFQALAIRAFSATQTANLQEWQTSTGSIKAYITPLGYLGVTQTNDQEVTSSILGQQVASTLQSYTTGTTAETLDNTYEAWKITVATTLNIRSVGISIRYTTAVPTNPTAYIRLHIYNDDGGAPSKPSTLRTSASTYTYYGQLTASFATQQQNFAYALAAGTYWIVAQRSAAPTGGGTVDIQVNNAAVADTYAYATTPPTWTNESNKTPRYYIFGRTFYGVYGYSDSNYGVRGYSVNTYGGYFTSVNGVGVYAQGNTYGGYFLSAYSYAVYATSTYGSAIYGTTTTGYGVQGNSTSGTSIYGVTTTGIGIYGNTTSGRGVYAVSTTGTSLECVTTSGVGSIVTANPATTNVEHELQRWTRTTSATAAIGIGLRNNYYIEDVGGTSRNVGRMSVVLTDVTANATIADLYVSLTNGSATLQEAFRIKGSGISYFRTGVALLESGSTPTYYTILQSADLTSSNSTYILPAALPASTAFLKSTSGGVWSWDTNVYLTSVTLDDAYNEGSEILIDNTIGPVTFTVTDNNTGDPTSIRFGITVPSGLGGVSIGNVIDTAIGMTLVNSDQYSYDVNPALATIDWSAIDTGKSGTASVSFYRPEIQGTAPGSPGTFTTKFEVLRFEVNSVAAVGAIHTDSSLIRYIVGGVDRVVVWGTGNIETIGDITAANLYLGNEGRIDFNSSDVALIHAANLLTLNGGNFDLDDNNIMNVGDIALDSISPNTTNISITIGAGVLGIGDGTYAWGHTPMVGIEGVLEVDGAVYFDSTLGMINTATWTTTNKDVTLVSYGLTCGTPTKTENTDYTGWTCDLGTAGAIIFENDVDATGLDDGLHYVKFTSGASSGNIYKITAVTGAPPPAPSRITVDKNHGAAQNDTFNIINFTQPTFADRMQWTEDIEFQANYDVFTGIGWDVNIEYDLLLLTNPDVVTLTYSWIDLDFTRSWTLGGPVDTSNVIVLDFDLFSGFAGTSYFARWKQSATDRFYVTSVGNTYIAGTLEVDGNSQFDAPSTFNSTVNINYTLTVGVDDTGYDVLFYGATSGKSWLWDENLDKMVVTGDVAVTGTTLFTGAVTIEGAVVINDTSADVDTRIESNGNANMVFVDGGNDRVGIGDGSPSYTLDVAGDISAQGFLVMGIYESTVTGTQNAFDTNGAGIVRWAGTSAMTLNGIAGGVHGRLLHIMCVGASGADVTVNNESGSASAGDRIITGTGLTITITDEGMLNLIYDGTSSRWRNIGSQG